MYTRSWEASISLRALGPTLIRNKSWNKKLSYTYNPKIYGFKQRYAEYSSILYFPIIAVYRARRIAIRDIGSHYGKICKSAGGTNEHVRLYGVGVC